MRPLNKNWEERMPYVDPLDTNYILLVTFGGVFKTINAGQTWACITDNSPITTGALNPFSITVNPNNTNQIFLGTVGGDFNTIPVEFGEYTQPPTYGGGIIYSLNGGQSWQQEIIQQGSVPDWYDNIEQVQKIFFSPDGNKLIAFVNNQIFYKDYPNGTWTKIFDPSNLPYQKYSWENISFIPGSNTDFFATSPNGDENGPNTTSLRRFSFNNGIYSSVEINLPDPGSTGSQTVVISPHSSSSLYVAIRDYTQLLESVSLYNYTYDPNDLNGTSSFTLINPLLPDGYTQGTYSLGMASTLDNPDVIYFYNEFAFLSEDGGVTWTTIGGYFGQPTHVDMRSCFIQHSENSLLPNDHKSRLDRVYFPNDGGICIKPQGKYIPSNGTTYLLENINGKGLSIGHQMGIGVSEEGSDLLIGAWHNSFQVFEPKENPAWLFDINGSDGGDAIFSRAVINKGYIQDHSYGIYQTLNNPGTTREIDDVPYMSDFPYVNPSNTYLGYEPHVYQVPKWADQYGGVYFGFTNMYRVKPGTYSFTQVSGSNPQIQQSDNILLRTTDLTSNIPKIRCMDFSAYANDHLTGYVAYDNGELYYRPKVDDPNNQKFQSKPNISTELQGRPITDIALDPHHPERVWVSIGGINWESDTRDRVVYSPDGGEHWFDVSKGLPQRIPVTQIEFHEGMNRLYASTDIGIYKLEMGNFSYSDINDDNSGYNSTEWTCFSKGAPNNPDYPNVFTTDMQIDYCSGKLYTTTYGRSAWATDLLSSSSSTVSTTIGDIQLEPEEEITSTPTQPWTGDIYIRTGIWVKNNSTLTISGTNTTIHMPKNGKIKVDPGSSLIIDGATITNDCDGMWYGIEAVGNSGLPQTAANQATVTIENDATIENARFAIANWDHNSISTTGGIIHASNSTFKNNHKSVAIEQYHHQTNSGYWVPYQAYFDKCHFIVDDQYRGDTYNYPFTEHASMWSVTGVQFRGCDFANTTTGASKGAGYGIHSYNAGYSVHPYTNSLNNYTNCTFNGFKAGVLAEGDDYDDLHPSVVVYNSDFTANGIGIWGRTIYDLRATGNNITIGDGEPLVLPECQENAGIYTENCTRFIIEQNNLTGSATSQLDKVGTITANSGEENKEISKNNYSALQIGALAEGKNSMSYLLPLILVSNYSGLRYFCNAFNENEKDIVVQADNHFEGIAIDQGTTLSSAGNTFSPSGSIYNNGHYINYFYNGSNTEPSVVSSSVFPQAAANPKNCETGLPYDSDWGPLTTTRKSELVSMLYTNLAIKQNEKTSYQSLLDGGNSDALIDYLNSNTTYNAIDIKDYILSLSPFLSDSAIRVLAAQNLLPESMLLEALEANPDALRNPDILGDVLTNVTSPLTEADLETLYDISFNTTARTGDESEISEAGYLVDYALTRLINDAKSDTTGTGRDSILHWLSVVNEKSADYERAGMYFGVNDFETGESILNGMPSKYSFNDDELTEHNNYMTLWGIMRGVAESDRNINQLTSQEIESLQNLRGTELKTHTNYIADAILVHTGNRDIEPCLHIYPFPLERKIRHSSANLSKEGVKVYPNPANRYVLFDYSYPNEKGTVTLVITDITGKISYQTNVKGNVGQTYWNLSNVTPGNYNYQFIDDKNKILATGKITVVK